jgi:hypothetical protein
MQDRSDEQADYEWRMADANSTHTQHAYNFSRSCGADVCMECGDHKGLARCFCGWSSSGGDGYKELVDMGEQIEED